MLIEIVYEHILTNGELAFLLGISCASVALAVFTHQRWEELMKNFD